MRLALALALVALAASPGLTFAQSADDISFKVDKERTRGNKIVLASLGGAAAVFTGVGVLFTLDSQSKSDEVSAAGQHTGLVWTADREETREAALRSRNVAIVNYSIAGALTLATMVYFIATDPGEEVVSYQSRAPTITPVEGGAVFGARWSWR